MTPDQFYHDIFNRLVSRYRGCAPYLREASLRAVLSPAVVPISRELLAKIGAAINSIYSISRQPAYQNHIIEQYEEAARFPPHCDSVLMAYDFHIDPKSGRAGLIEINTNASGFLLVEALYTDLFVDALDQVKSSFHAEMTAGPVQPVKTVAIIDEEPASQNMYPEFLMYNDLFGQMGLDSRILDFRELLLPPERNSLIGPGDKKIDFIYNRLTDFLFSRDESRHLRWAYENRVAGFSPHPKAYLLLADKQRLIDFSRPGWLESLGIAPELIAGVREVLLPAYEPDHFGSAEELWRARKHLFFKPKRSFGAKSTYRGSSISRKVFERLLGEETVIQEFMPAAEMKVPFAEGLWKYDIRFFVYKGRIQLGAARLYRGQVTNFREPLGGFARLQPE